MKINPYNIDVVIICGDCEFLDRAITFTLGDKCIKFNIELEKHTSGGTLICDKCKELVEKNGRF